MREFIDYYIKFLRYFWENIKEFFRLIGKAFSNVFYHNIVKHFNLLNELSNRFRPLDWVFTILVMTINIAFILFLLIRLIQLLRRYLKFNKMEVTKEKLLDEITLLSQKVVDVTNEKNQILTLKMENLGLYTKKLEKEKKDPKEKIPSRFTKLIEVDEAYDRSPYLVVMDEGDLLSLKELVTRFVNFSASELKLYYEEETIRAFFAGMATSKIIILEGISGTGKTSLPYAMGRFFNNPADIISVQPSWRDRSEMIGYLNEFTKRFNESDFLKALYEATYRDDLNFIVLDELNLARIEYYFAEFLSIMEMPNPSDWQIEVVPSSELGDPLHLINGKILVAPNIWFIGTANKDDSTFTITDKVYDRASVIEMDARIDKIDAPYGESVNMSYDYLDNLFKEAQNNLKISVKTLNDLDKLDEFITAKFKITFGNRILKQIHDFIPVYIASGGDEVGGLDYMVARKILRKFESLNIPFLVDEIKELLIFIQKTFGKNNFKLSTEFLESLLKQI